MPVLIADKPDGQVSLPGLQLDQYYNVLGSHLCADGSESLQMLVVATMQPNWRWSDALATMTGGPPCWMGGYLASGALHLVTPDEVQTVNAGQCFAHSP